MEKRISYSQFQSVKCVAKACDPLISKRNKLGEKLQKIAQEYKDCDTQIQSLEAGIVAVIGLRVDKLVKKVIEPGVDVNGQPKKTTKYLPTDIVAYDEKHKQYVITLDEENEETKCDNEASDAASAENENIAGDNAGAEGATPETATEETPTEDVPTDMPVF